MNTLPLTTKPAGGPKPQQGSGLALTSNRFGWSYSADASGSRYPHPFKPSLGAGGVSFSKGLVEVYEPVIKKEKISTGAVLELDSKVAVKGESWCCIEAVPNEFGSIDAHSKLEIVHTNQPTSIDPDLARVAIVQILWQDDTPIQAFEIVYFNVRYERVKPTAGPVRHLFR